MKAIIKKGTLALMLLLGIQNAVAQEPTYKGVWGRLEFGPGLGFSLSQLPPNLDQHGPYISSYAVVLGYHINNKWSMGIGPSFSGHLTPNGLIYKSVFVEGAYRPFEGDLSPMTFHLRTLFPVGDISSFSPKPNVSISMGWANRNKLWNLFGAEVSVGLNYLPYGAEEQLPAHGGVTNSPSASTVKIHNLSKISAFLRVGITMN